jgi:hypothetical protein
MMMILIKCVIMLKCTVYGKKINVVNNDDYHGDDTVVMLIRMTLRIIIMMMWRIKMKILICRRYLLYLLYI